MKKVHNAENHEKALDELFKRYEERGAAYNRSPEYTEQKTREIEMRANTRKSFKVSGQGARELHKYKNGVSGARRYMTDGDFTNYYKATRDYTPDANMELDTTVLLQRMDQVRYGKKDNMNNKYNKNDVKSKLKAEADKTNPKNVKKEVETKKSVSTEKKQAKASSKIKEVAKVAAKTWIPLEERNEEKVVQGGKTRIPGTLILAIIVITISLLMIVGSAVLLGSAQNEQNELRDKIAAAETEIAELRTDLDRKNANADIEIFAKEELGMISQEHVNFEYISSNKTDGVEKHQSEKVSFSSLMNWIFQQFK